MEALERLDFSAFENKDEARAMALFLGIGKVSRTDDENGWPYVVGDQEELNELSKCVAVHYGLSIYEYYGDKYAIGYLEQVEGACFEYLSP